MNFTRLLRFRIGWVSVTHVAATVLSLVIATPWTATSQDMVFPGEQWTQATPESQRVDSARLEKAVRYLESYTPRPTGASQLAVVRNGRMIWEGANADRAHEVWSVTKSFTSSILGLLINDGVISLDTPAANYFPELAEQYGDVTLQHLVNMTSPWRAVGENNGRISSLSDTLWVPDKPLFQPAGAESYYSNANYEVFSRVLTRATGQRLDDFFRERIGERIGMTNWTWTDWDGTVNAAPDGIVVNRGSHGLNVSAQDAARYGHLFLNDGLWNDEQVISAEWVHQATSAQVDVTLPLNPRNRTAVIMGINGGPGIYGDGWWTNGKNPEGNRILPGVPPETFFAYGIDNNFIFVVPEWDMVVVREATNEGDRSVSNNVWATFLNLVGDAILDVPGGDSVHGADAYTRLPYAAYQTRDSDGDGNGDRVDNLLGKSTEVFKTYVGELDLAAGASQYRVVAKFALPNVSKTGPALQLEDATLRWHLERVVGVPAEPVSVFHSVTDNDTDALASDHEDTSYTSTQRALVQPSDLAQQYYETDVTAFVLSDYDTDGSDALSAFRLELIDPVVIADRQSQGYEFAIAGNRAHYPELVLKFGYVGDLNRDGTLDVGDIDLLTASVRGGEMNSKFDLDNNGTVDGADRTVWVRDLRHTWIGDANLDGRFDRGDLVEVLVAGKYKDNVALNATWRTGDWNGDGDFDTGDLVAALIDGGYDQGPRSALSAIPEPGSGLLLAAGLIALAISRHRRARN